MNLETRANKLKIGIDVDEVLAEFFGKVLAYHNRKNGTNILGKNITRYRLWENEEWGLSKEETMREISEYCATEDYGNLPVVENSQTNVLELYRMWHDLNIVTSRSSELEAKTISWIRNNFPNVFSSFNFGDDKSKICLDRGFDLMIEDSPIAARRCAEKGIHVLLFDYPWNNGNYNLDSNPNIHRIKGWDEALRILR